MITEPIIFVITKETIVMQITEQPIIFSIGEGIPLILNINNGAKSSNTDAGYLGEVSIDNDHLFICVQSGEIGFAVWKQFYGVAT